MNGYVMTGDYLVIMIPTTAKLESNPTETDPKAIFAHIASELSRLWRECGVLVDMEVSNPEASALLEAAQNVERLGYSKVDGAWPFTSKVDGAWPFTFTLGTSQVYLFAVKVSPRGTSVPGLFATLTTQPIKGFTKGLLWQ